MYAGEDVAEALSKKQHHNQAHDDGKNRVDPARGLNATCIQVRRQQRERDDPEAVRNAQNDVARRLTAPNDADDWVQQIVHQHRPADNITKLRV
jgi:hypothetical protein